MVFGIDFHLAPGWRGLAHGLECIAHEIDQDLLDLVRVALDRGEIFGKRHLDLAEVSGCIGLHYVRHARHNVVQVEAAPDGIPSRTASMSRA